MPRQNRVTPEGRLEAVAARGLLTGNRGVLHDASGAMGQARWRHPHWIACLLRFKDSERRRINEPGRWTQLFFLDEAVALAAGHRPCAYCRRADFNRFLDAWETAFGRRARVPEIDALLHAARVVPRTRRQVTHRAPLPDLPDGCFLRWEGQPWLVLGDALHRWTHAGYDAWRPRAAGEVEVLTPAPLVAVLRAGYRPTIHPSALDQRPGGSRVRPFSASAAR